MGKRFKFRLASLLRIKQQLLDQQEGRLRSLNQEVQQARRQVARIHAAMAEENESLKSGSGDIASVLSSSAVFEAQLMAASQAESESQNRWNEAKTTYVAMSHELSSLQNMRDAQRETHQAELASAEQMDLDEIALRKWTK